MFDIIAMYQLEMLHLWSFSFNSLAKYQCDWCNIFSLIEYYKNVAFLDVPKGPDLTKTSYSTTKIQLVAKEMLNL